MRVRGSRTNRSVRRKESSGGEPKSDAVGRPETAPFLRRKRGIVPGSSYQEDLVTPGIRPLVASSRKVIREILKRRR